MQVKQILDAKAHTGVETVPPETSVADVAALLDEKRIGAVVVSKSGKTADGILSERDIVRALARRGTGCLEESAAEIMTPDPVCCDYRDSSNAVFGKMTEGRFRHLPVVEAGEMVGLISIGDVVKAELTVLSQEKQALEGMIMGADVGG